MSDIITGTPADLTYGHLLVQEAWLAVWVVTSAALAFIIGWIGLSLITQEPLGARQTGWRELIPAPAQAERPGRAACSPPPRPRNAPSTAPKPILMPA